MWSSLGSAAKKSLLNEQRQWLKNKDLACGKVDQQADDATTIKMFTCQNEITQKRVIELKNKI
ncbi:lysozyme inhibitor LprI family protein [Yersinia aleksiciae]|uniref:lysozyme inhibitor LprI family protein n=1 Tax=Yersinia aleksiciae TaxID=263819 RepID=UPI0036F2DBD6